MLRRLFGLEEKIPPMEPIPPAFFERAREQNIFTPDHLDLESRRAVPLFVFDDLQKGHKHHDMIEDCSAILGGCETEQPFTAFHVDRLPISGDSSFTGVIAVDLSFQLLQALPVQGELYAVYPRKIPELDRYKRNGVLFHRIRVSVKMTWRDEKFVGDKQVTELRVWMYVAKAEQWAPRIDDGFHFKPITHFSKNDGSGDYYRYTRQEASNYK